MYKYNFSTLGLYPQENSLVGRLSYLKNKRTGDINSPCTDSEGFLFNLSLSLEIMVWCIYGK